MALRRSYPHFLALFLYSVLTLIMTYPAIFRLKVAIIGDYVDSFLNTWILAWGVRNILGGNWSSLFEANIFYPYKNTLAYSEHLLGEALTAVPIQLVFHDPLVTFNISVLIGFVLTALGMYLLVWYLTRNGYAAFFSGLLFSFFPWRIAHIAHLQLLSAQWLPLTFLFLHKTVKSFSYRNLFGAAFFYILAFYSCGYYGLFLTLYVVVFMVLALQEGWEDRYRLTGRFTLFFLFSLLIILPVYLPYLKLKMDFGFVRPLGEVVFFSADFVSFLSIPLQNHLWGKILESFVKPEGELFMGLVAFFAALTGIWSLSQGKKGSASALPAPLKPFKAGRPRVLLLQFLILIDGIWLVSILLFGGFSVSLGSLRLHLYDLKPPVMILLFLLTCLFLLDRHLWQRIRPFFPRFSSPEPRFYFYLLVLSFLLTLGPVIHFNGRPIAYGPYLLLYEWVPGFDGLRVPARFVVMMHLAVSVFAGYGLAWLLNRIRSTWKRSLLGTGFALLALIEYASFPISMPSVPVGRDFPQVYIWLAQQPGDFAILEMPVPTRPEDVSRDAPYVYFSAYHWKKLVNGYSGFIPPGYTRLYKQELKGFPSEGTLRRLHQLGQLGVRYIIVHLSYYPQREREQIITLFLRNPQWFTPEKLTNEAIVYRVLLP
jgi:hypothetical protein